MRGASAVSFELSSVEREMKVMMPASSAKMRANDAQKRAVRLRWRAAMISVSVILRRGGGGSEGRLEGYGGVYGGYRGGSPGEAGGDALGGAEGAAG